MLDFNLTSPNTDDDFSFSIFTADDDADHALDCCDRPSAAAPILAIDEPYAPAYLTHLDCFLAAAVRRNYDDAV